MIRITIDTDSRSVAETVLDDFDGANFNPSPKVNVNWDFPGDSTITDAEYAEFGKRVAARLGSASVWSNSADFLEEFDALAVVHLGTTIGSGSPDLMEFWREQADALGIEHDGGDEDEEYDPFAPHVN